MNSKYSEDPPEILCVANNVGEEKNCFACTLIFSEQQCQSSEVA